MNTINRLLDMLDNFVANMEYGFTHLSEAIHDPMFLGTLSTILPLMAMAILLLFVFTALSGRNGPNKTLLYVGFTLSLFLLVIGIGIELFLK